MFKSLQKERSCLVPSAPRSAPHLPTEGRSEFQEPGGFPGLPVDLSRRSVLCWKVENEASCSSRDPYERWAQGVFTLCPGSKHSLFHNALICQSGLYDKMLTQPSFMSLTNIYQVPKCARHYSGSKRKQLCGCVRFYYLQNVSFNLHISLENRQ